MTDYQAVIAIIYRLFMIPQLIIMQWICQVPRYSWFDSVHTHFSRLVHIHIVCGNHRVQLICYICPASQGVYHCNMQLQDKYLTDETRDHDKIHIFTACLLAISRVSLLLQHSLPMSNHIWQYKHSHVLCLRNTNRARSVDCANIHMPVMMIETNWTLWRPVRHEDTMIQQVQR